MPSKTTTRLAAISLALLSPAAIAWLFYFAPWECSTSSIQEMSWQIESMKRQQSANESIVFLSDQFLEWEKLVDDFSMNEQWMEHKDRAILKLQDLEIDIPALQSKIDQCNQKGE